MVAVTEGCPVPNCYDDALESRNLCIRHALEELMAHGAAISRPLFLGPRDDERYELLLESRQAEKDRLDAIGYERAKKRIAEMIQEELSMTEYGERSLQSIADRVAKESGKGNRNNLLNLTSWQVGRLVGMGHLNIDVAQKFLSEVENSIGLPKRESSRVVESGFRAGVTAGGRA